MNDGYWHAVGMLRLDRRQGLSELERVFGRGEAPRKIEGPLRGRLVATTVGYGSDAAFEAMARAWLPWRGKSFAPASAEGRNLFTPGGDRTIALTFPTYRGRGSDGTGRTAFRFVTSVGASQTHPETDVLRIDYRDLTENPAWPVRRVLDELVQMEDDLFLGQALMRWRGELRRGAWFSLER